MRRAERLLVWIALAAIIGILAYSHRESCVLCGKFKGWQQDMQRLKERGEV